MFDHFFRRGTYEDWCLIHSTQVPPEILELIHTGRVGVCKDGYYRAVPRNATTTELIDAANALSQTLNAARVAGDFHHPATQLRIEMAHDRFRKLSGHDDRLPPIVTDPTQRRRWKPVRKW